MLPFLKCLLPSLSLSSFLHHKSHVRASFVVSFSVLCLPIVTFFRIWSLNSSLFSTNSFLYVSFCPCLPNPSIPPTRYPSHVRYIFSSLPFFILIIFSNTYFRFHFFLHRFLYPAPAPMFVFCPHVTIAHRFSSTITPKSKKIEVTLSSRFPSPKPLSLFYFIFHFPFFIRLFPLNLPSHIAFQSILFPPLKPLHLLHSSVFYSLRVIPPHPCLLFGT